MADKTSKKIRVLELFMEIDFQEPFFQYFDLDSEKLLDEKIEVLEALKAGKTIAEIPHFYDVLELLPKNGTWD